MAHYSYTELKEKARQIAQDWQTGIATEPMSWGEAAAWSDYFERLGKRFGLLREFRENAIL